MFKLDFGFVESMRHFICFPFSSVKKASHSSAPFSAPAFCLGVFDRGDGDGKWMKSERGKAENRGKRP